MKKTKGILLALLSSGTFGLIAFFSIPLLKAGIHTPSILFYRSLLAAILLGIICLIRKKNFRIPPKTAIQLFFMGMLYTVTAMGLIYSYTYISSGVSTTLHFLYPIVVSCLMIIFYKEKKSLTLFMAAVASLIGVGLLCWSDEGFISTRGLFIVLITVFTYAVYIVNLGRPLFKKLEPEVLMFYVMLYGAFMFSVYASFTTGIEIMPDSDAWFNIIGLVLFATILSGLSLITAVKYAGSTITSILGSMEPVVATLIGIFYFHESFGWNSFAGLTLIITSVILVVMMNRKKEKNAKTIVE